MSIKHTNLRGPPGVIGPFARNLLWPAMWQVSRASRNATRSCVNGPPPDFVPISSRVRVTRCDKPLIIRKIQNHCFGIFWFFQTCEILAFLGFRHILCVTEPSDGVKTCKTSPAEQATILESTYGYLLQSNRFACLPSGTYTWTSYLTSGRLWLGN
jgi:hypothetical protein